MKILYSPRMGPPYIQSFFFLGPVSVLEKIGFHHGLQQFTFVLSYKSNCCTKVKKDLYSYILLDQGCGMVLIATFTLTSFSINCILSWGVCLQRHKCISTKTKKNELRRRGNSMKQKLLGMFQVIFLYFDEICKMKEVGPKKY